MLPTALTVLPPPPSADVPALNPETVAAAGLTPATARSNLRIVVQRPDEDARTLICSSMLFRQHQVLSS